MPFLLFLVAGVSIEAGIMIEDVWILRTVHARDKYADDTSNGNLIRPCPNHIIVASVSYISCLVKRKSYNFPFCSPTPC